MSDLIKREDAIEIIDKMICDNKWVCECAYIHGIEPIDKDIEVVAWMPLPKPYREDSEA